MNKTLKRQNKLFLSSLNKKLHQLGKFILSRRNYLLGLLFFLTATVLIAKRYLPATSSAENNYTTAPQSLNQEFTFQGRDATGSPSSAEVVLSFNSVNKREEVYIKGQRAQARNEKLFLVFDISLRNNNNSALFLDPIDLVRLVENENDKIAPQVTQGILEARPQSTKKSNLGFVVPQEKTKFTIQVGELEGEKKTFEVNFKS